MLTQTTPRILTTASDYAWHAVRLISLTHDGEDLPNDTSEVITLVALAEALNAFILAIYHPTTFTYIMFFLGLLWNMGYLLIGRTKPVVWNALISAASNFLLLVWLANGAHDFQTTWTSTLYAFAWVRAALQIGFF